MNTYEKKIKPLLKMIEETAMRAVASFNCVRDTNAKVAAAAETIKKMPSVTKTIIPAIAFVGIMGLFCGAFGTVPVTIALIIALFVVRHAIVGGPIEMKKEWVVGAIAPVLMLALIAPVSVILASSFLLAAAGWILSVEK